MEKTGGSRLMQMQARFQQKQMQERELKIASLYEAQQARALGRVRMSPSSNGVSPTQASPPPPHPITQPGKVRQMFEERRTKGIDKSYPLQPIQNTERPAPRKALPNGYAKVTSTASRTTVAKKTNRTHTSSSTHSIKKQHNLQKTDSINGSGDLNHNHHEPDINSNIKHELPQSNGEIVSSIDEMDKVDNNYLIENETFPEALAPIPTPRSPEKVELKKPPPRRSPATSSPMQSTKPPTQVTTQRRVSNENLLSGSAKAHGAMQRGAQPVPRRPTEPSKGSKTTARVARGATSAAHGVGAPTGGASPGGGSAGGVPCPVCGRHFAADRVEKHQQICAKSHSKKRKPFDALKHRLAGTEAESLIGKLRKGNASSTKVASKNLNSNWRQKHEEFISAIRAAKQVQAHLNAGGKLSDLPPPPPSENPDYVQCPHCSRRFNQAAAERHIPKCASYQFNKPKPAASKRR